MKRPADDSVDGDDSMPKKAKTGGRYSLSGPVTINDCSVFECPVCEKFLHEPVIMCIEGAYKYNTARVMMNAVYVIWCLAKSTKKVP